MADGQQNQGNQNYGNQFFLKEQASRMLNAIQKGYSDNFPNQESTSNVQSGNQQVVATLYMNQQQQPPQQVVQHPQQNQVQQQQLQNQLQQVQQAQNQFQQIQQIAQMQQQFQQQYTSTSDGASNVNVVLSSPIFCPMRRGRKPVDKRKRRRHTWVKRPTTAYLYFVSKYRETLKEAGEVVPKAKIITQACAEKWRNMSDKEKEPFLELSRRDRERWEKDKALEKKPRDPNRPKRPPSAYFLFLADFRKSYPGKADPAKEITKKAGEAWNNLSDQEKNPYYSQAQVIRSKWEEDLEKYRQSTGLDKNSSMNRSSSMDSDSNRLELDSDASPRGGDLAELDPTMLQESAMLEMPSGQSFDDGQGHPSTSSDVDAMTSSDLTYDYNPVGKRESEIAFTGR